MENYEKLMTYGAIRDMVEQTETVEPVLQVLAYKNVTADMTKRYRFMLSDGQFTHQCCILMGEPVQAVENGQLERFTIIRLKKYVCNPIGGKRVIIMLEFNVLASGASVGRKIGNPVQYDGPDTKAPPLPAGAQGAGSTSNVGSSMSSNQWNSSNNSSSSNTNSSYTKPFGQSENTMNSFNGEKRKKIEGGYIPIKPNDSFGSNTLNPAMCLPISTLTVYQNKWVIKGRVVSKTPKRTWQNAKGEGCLFSFDLSDDSGTIRITAFKAEADKFFDQVQLGNAIILSRGQVKAANNRFSNTGHQYEIVLTSDSILESLSDDSGCPKITYNFVRISEIERISPESTVDVAGVICSASDVQTFTSKTTNREMKKRDLQIVDQSNTQIRVTLWGQEAVDFQMQPNMVLVGRSLKVSDFSGRSLGPVSNSTILFNPELEVVFTLRGWYDRTPDAANARNLSGGTGNDAGSRLSGQLTHMDQINEAAVGKGLTQATVDATIVQTSKANSYKSCPTCNRKLSDMNNGMYRCNHCDKDLTDFCYRVILKVLVADHTGNTWITLFHSELERLLDIDFNATGICNEERVDELSSLIGSLNHRRFTMSLRCRIENYNERDRVNSLCNAAAKYNPIEHGRRLLASLKASN